MEIKAINIKLLQEQVKSMELSLEQLRELCQSPNRLVRDLAWQGLKAYVSKDLKRMAEEKLEAKNKNIFSINKSVSAGEVSEADHVSKSKESSVKKSKKSKKK